MIITLSFCLYMYHYQYIHPQQVQLTVYAHLNMYLKPPFIEYLSTSLILTQLSAVFIKSHRVDSRVSAVACDIPT